jgi:hypothetical protein
MLLLMQIGEDSATAQRSEMREEEESPRCSAGVGPT